MSLILSNGIVQSNTTVNARIPKNLLFTYMPHYTSVYRYNIGLQNYINTYDDYDANQTNNPLGKALGKQYSDVFGTGGINVVANDFNSGSIQEPTLTVYNDTESLYNYKAYESVEYVIGFWVRINRFPTKNLVPDTFSSIRKKRINLIRMIYGTDNNGFDQNNISGMIEFGALAPHYIHNGSMLYRNLYSPFSFSCTITYPNNIVNNIVDPSGTPRTFSYYTNFEFNLNTWYFVQIKLMTEDSFENSPLIINTSMYVNNIQKNIMGHPSKIVSNHGSGSSAQNNKRKSSRFENQVATGPGYVTKDGYPVYNNSEYIRDYYRFPYLTYLNHISFSPVWSRGYLGRKDSSYMTGVGSGVDFGQFYIYNTYDTTLYNTHKGLYI